MQAPNGNPTQPPLRPIIDRPRLLRALDECSCRITVLFAPAGYGKTTLARQWLSSRPHIEVRFSSDVRPLAALTSAVQRQARCQEPGKCTTGACPTYESIRNCITGLVQHNPGTIIWMDDLQVLSSDEEVARIVGTLVAETDIKVLLSTRRLPEWIRPRDVVHGAVGVIDDERLGFTLQECKRLLRSCAPQEAARIGNYFEGWPALVALSHQGFPQSSGRRNRNRRLSHWVTGYLADEVLAGLSADALCLAEALAHTSQGFEDAESSIVGLPGFQDLANELREAGAIARSRPRQDRLYLRRSVRDHLITNRMSSASTAVLEPLVARLLERNRLVDALSVSLAFSLEDAVRRSLEALSTRHSDSDVLIELEELLPSVPETLEVYTYALRAEIASLRGRFAEAEAYSLLASAHPATPSASSQRALIIAGRSAHLTQREHRARDHFAAASSVGTGRSGDEAEAAWGDFVARSSIAPNDTEQLRQLLDRATSLTPEGRLRYATGLFALGRGAGDMSEATDALETVSALVEECSRPVVLLAYLHARSHALMLNGRHLEALSVTKTALTLARETKADFALPHLFVTQAIADSTLGHYPSAHMALAAARDAVQDERAIPYVEMNVAAATSRMRLLQGDCEGAVSACVGDWRAVNDPAMQAELHAALALAQYASGDLSASVGSVHRSEASWRWAEARVLLGARSVLEAFETATPGRLIAIGEDLERRCLYDGVVLATRVEPRIAEQLSTGLIGDTRRPRTMRLSGDRYPAEIGLTRRETEIADLLLLGLANAAIARSLFISEATVKLHLRHIYSKLKVNSRTEAVLKLLRARSADH